VQTPQIFKSSILRKAYTQEFDQAFTDDASVVEAMGIKITLVDGERTNIKLTTPEDMEWAEWMLQREECDK
jgi:2-C-methyl-D-erythritol 4-phosphate cytidylyltransferase